MQTESGGKHEGMLWGLWGWLGSGSAPAGQVGWNQDRCGEGIWLGAAPEQII